jgi:sialate O-acetylesterase
MGPGGPSSATILVSFAGQRVQTVAGEDGTWSANLAALEAGGPHTLSAESDNGMQQAVRDVLVGDVYLCSGQSNMEWPVDAAMNVHHEIGSAENSRIRHMTVRRAASPTPLAVFADPVAWEVASPETVGRWSAVCYYFARELQPYIDVPIGLIHASWGGTDIRSWMDAAALREIGGYDDAIRLLDLHRTDEQAAQQAFGEQWEAWWSDHTVRSGRR